MRFSNVTFYQDAAMQINEQTDRWSEGQRQWGKHYIIKRHFHAFSVH